MHARRSTTTSPGSAQGHEGGKVHHCADASHGSAQPRWRLSSFPTAAGCTWDAERSHGCPCQARCDAIVVHAMSRGMATQQTLLAVIDTNVLFEGMTTQGVRPDASLRRSAGDCYGLCRDGFGLRISRGVLWEGVGRALAAAPARGGGAPHAGPLCPIYFSWRPMSPDPGDEHVIDGAMNARAPVVTANTRDLRLAAQTLGLVVLTPVEFVTRLASMA